LLPSIGADDLRALLDALIGKRIRFAIIEDFDFGVVKESLPLLRVRFSESLLAKETPRLAGVRGGLYREHGRPGVSGRDGPACYTETEQKVAGLWLQVLGYENVSVYDNFFDLGGDSLMALRLLEGVKRLFDMDLGVNDIYRHPSIVDLANHVDRLLAEPGYVFSQGAEQENRPSTTRSSQPVEVVKRPLQVTHPLPEQSRALSFFQERLWIAEQLDPGNPVNAISFAVRVEGKLSITALFQSVSDIVRRHEILRTTFAVLNAQPVQIVASDFVLAPLVVDLHELSTARQTAEIRELAVEDARHPFDLTRGPMLRVTLLKLAGNEHVFLMTVHHIVFDGWSTGVFLQELAVLYRAFSEGGPSPLADLSFQFADFAQQQRHRLRGKAFDALVSYWKEQLADAPPVLELPADYPRPRTLAFLGQTYPLVLSQNLLGGLWALSEQEGVTLFLTILAAFLALLHLYTGQSDLVVGALSAHRNQPETKKLIGPFVNTLILRADLSGNPTFRELLALVRRIALEASAHQELTYEQIVEAVQPKRDSGHTPLVQVVLDFNVSPMQGVEFSDLKLTPLTVEKEMTRFDLALEMVMDGDEQELTGVFEYNTDLFKPATIARLADHFRTFLQNVVAQPDVRV
jgi:acyl carrier protein